jgi:hypothetical protein
VKTGREKDQRSPDEPAEPEAIVKAEAETEAFRSACRHYARRAAHLRR